MPRPIGSVQTPKYCFHKSSGRAYVTLNGKPVYLGKYNSPESRAAYDRVVGLFLAAGRQTPSPAGNDTAMTVSMLLASFWEHAQKEYPDPAAVPGKRPNGELGNYWDVIRPLRRLYGLTPAAQFGPLALKALREEFIRLGWCRNYINRQVSRVKCIFRWAVANELLPASVHQALTAVSGLRRGRSEARESARVRPVPLHVLAAILPHLCEQVRAMVELQILSGMRPGELCAMRSGDIDTVGSVWIYRPRRHKTEHHDHEREIRLGPRAQRILRPLLKADLAAHIFAPAQAEAERHRRQREQRKTPLTPSQLARAERARRRQRRRPPQDHWSVASYRRAIARACDRADELARAQAGAADGQRIIPRWHPHQLRHNFATAIRRDYGPEAALVLLGDRTTRMIDVYAEKDRATAEQIIAAVG